MRCPSCNIVVTSTTSSCPACGFTLHVPATGATQRLRPTEPTRPLMQQGICPACGATTIYTDQQFSDYRRSWNGTGYRLVVGQTMLSPKFAKVTNYACTSCGYLERYILNEEARNDIAQQWTHISPARGK